MAGCRFSAGAMSRLQPHFMASFLWEINTREGSRSAMVGISNKQTCQIHKSPCFRHSRRRRVLKPYGTVVIPMEWVLWICRLCKYLFNAIRHWFFQAPRHLPARLATRQGQLMQLVAVDTWRNMALSENRGCPLSWPIIETWLSQATILDVSQDAKRQTMANHDKPKYIHKRIINEQPISL